MKNKAFTIHCEAKMTNSITRMCVPYLGAYVVITESCLDKGDT
jgi:hypothetical protein